jgi:hypothetical protein
VEAGAAAEEVEVLAALAVLEEEVLEVVVQAVAGNYKNCY